MNASPLAELVRNEVVESVHVGHVAVCDPDGEVALGVGDPALDVYVRSAAKPFQAAAVVDLLASVGQHLDSRGVAIATASHLGESGQQVEAARLLAIAGLDEAALRCPPALPADLPTLLAQRGPTRLAHNCSGKHAGLLLAHTAAGGDPARYLRRDARIQRLARDQLAAAAGRDPGGPGVDGCGAPAWRLPLRGLATAFARLGAPGRPALDPVALAMRSEPQLVGGPGSADTALMQADARVIAKRGAEGVLAVGFDGPAGPVGLALKISDGAARATAPVAVALLSRLGARVPTDSPWGNVPGGALRVSADFLGRLSGLRNSIVW